MTREGFARLAFEAHYNAANGEGGWNAWLKLEEREQRLWLEVGWLINEFVRQAKRDDVRVDEPTPDGEPKPAERYALVEQMGFRRTYGTVRETEFCGRPMLEVTSIETGAVHLVAPESLYQVTWLTRAQAEAATRTGSHSPAALSAAIAGDLASWGADDEYDREQAEEGNRTGHAGETDDDRDHHGDEGDETGVCCDGECVGP